MAEKEEMDLKITKKKICVFVGERNRCYGESAMKDERTVYGIQLYSPKWDQYFAAVPIKGFNTYHFEVYQMQNEGDVDLNNKPRITLSESIPSFLLCFTMIARKIQHPL